jgi:hypothetical protein
MFVDVDLCPGVHANVYLSVCLGRQAYNVLTPQVLLDLELSSLLELIADSARCSDCGLDHRSRMLGDQSVVWLLHVYHDS